MSIPFGKRVKEARESLGLSAQECADRVTAAYPDDTMSRSGWSQIEGGKNDPRKKTIRRVAAGLGESEQTVGSWADRVMDTTNEVDEFRIGMGRRIARFREGRFTQEELAQAVGMSRPWIEEIEAGRRGPEAFYLLKLSEALEVSIEVLYGKEQQALLQTEGDLKPLLQEYLDKATVLFQSLLVETANMSQILQSDIAARTTDTQQDAAVDETPQPPSSSGKPRRARKR
jgi:transcriptional regulator with XRE-family HTH domain